MKKTLLTLFKILAWALLVGLWTVIEGLLLISWFSIMVYSIGGWIPFITANVLLILSIVYREKIRMRILTSVMCATIIGVLISGITFVGITTYSSDFTTEKWINYPAGRSAMIEDLEEEHVLVGMSKDEIIKLLGEPDNISQFLYGYETYEYYNHHTYGLDNIYRVNFDIDGIVTHIYHSFD